MNVLPKAARTKRRLPLFRLWLRIILVVNIILMSLAIIFTFYFFALEAPPLEVAETTRFYGNDGTLIGEYDQGKKRYWVELEEMSPHIIHATIAIEDRKFYEHFGFDFLRIGAAAIANIKSGAKVQGASTITQQYARNLYLGHEKTWTRKILEALYALRLEMNYDKDEILEGYLNTIYYGHGAYGIEAASLFYFQKHAKDLTLAEAAILAGIPKGPTYYSPLVNFERAKNRQHLILDAMAEEKYITKNMAEKAKKEKLTFKADENEQIQVIGPYFQDVVKQQLVEKYGLDEQLVESGGLEIYTSLDPVLQKEAEKWVTQEMKNFEKDLEVALVALDPRNGDVLALIGGRDYVKSPYNRAADAKRAPGSTLKPFLYYAALEHGFTPSSTLLSEPTTFTYDEGRTKWTPANFGNLYAHDFITLLQAIAFSDNIYAVKTHLFLGTEELVKTAKRFGIHSPLENVPSLALGTSPVTLLELTKSYAPFANGGSIIEPRFIRKVVDKNGRVLVEEKPKLKKELDERYIYIMNDLMSAMFDVTLPGYTTPTGSSVAHLLNRPMSGKSGSTPADSWMIGYTRQLVAGVWIGYDENKTLNHAQHGTIAKRIWAIFMESALKDDLILQYKKPEGVIGVYIDPETGLLASEKCPSKRLTYFIEGTEPADYCPLHSDEPIKEDEKEEENEKEKFLDRFFKWFH